jgi:RNA polymerase sigma-70 factor (ECF subfamily)
MPFQNAGILSRIAIRRATRERPKNQDQPNRPELPSGDRHLTDDDRFEVVIRPHIGRLLTIARGIVGSDDLAWDAVQEALLALWRHGEMPPNVEAWLVRAVAMRSLFVLRTQRRRDKHEQIASRMRAEPMQAGSPAYRIESEELQQRLEEALAELPDQHRVVFVLREIDGMDYESIAETIGVPIGTVRSRLNRARSALREIVKRRVPSEYLPAAWFEDEWSPESIGKRTWSKRKGVPQ